MEREIKPVIGDNLNSIVYLLLAYKARGESAFCIFKGHRFSTKTISIKGANIEIEGITKEEFENKLKNELQEKDKKTKEISSTWIERSKKFITPELYEIWLDYINYYSNGIENRIFFESVLQIMEVFHYFTKENLEKAVEMFNANQYDEDFKKRTIEIIKTFLKNGYLFEEEIKRTNYGL